MIKVIPKDEEPRKRVECINCGSMLEYAHSDTYHDWYCDYGLKLDIHALYITCPACRYRLKVREWAVDCL